MYTCMWTGPHAYMRVQYYGTDLSPSLNEVAMVLGVDGDLIFNNVGLDG